MKKCIAMALGLLLSGAAAAQDFPVTVQHSWGKTTLQQAPDRVVALSLPDYDTLVSLGVQPVNYVVHRPTAEIKYWPWNKSIPKDIPILPQNNISFEVIAALRPDLIAASNMWNMDNLYPKLSSIAPTIAGVNSKKWSSDSWQERTMYLGRLTGKKAQAKKVVSNTEKTIQQFIKRHPELKGKTFTFNSYTPGYGIGTVVDSSHSTSRFLKTFGLSLPSNIKKMADSSSNQIRLSAEGWGNLKADYVFVGYENAEDQKDLEANPFFKNLINSEGVNYIPLNYKELVALHRPDPLSIPWLLDSLEAKLK